MEVGLKPRAISLQGPGTSTAHPSCLLVDAESRVASDKAFLHLCLSTLLSQWEDKQQGL